jgi:hypothetical protein
VKKKPDDQEKQPKPKRTPKIHVLRDNRIEPGKLLADVKAIRIVRTPNPRRTT